MDETMIRDYEMNRWDLQNDGEQIKYNNNSETK